MFITNFKNFIEYNSQKETLTPMPYIIAIINEVSEISDSSFLQLTIILISLEPSKAY